MAILLVNIDNSINWIGDTWDPNLSLENVSKYEIEGTVEEVLNGFNLHEVSWTGTSIEESAMSKYSKTEEYINDSIIYEERLNSGVSNIQAREDLFINMPL